MKLFNYSNKLFYHCYRNIPISILIITLTFSFLSTGNIYSQEQKFKFKNINLSLSDNGTRAIIEDYKGFMWFGTESGLNRSDGYNLVLYTNHFGDSTSISNNKILSLYESNNKELIIGTSNGISIYNRPLNNFTQFFYKGQHKTQAFNTIFDILEDKDGTIWLATRGGICLLNKEKKRIERVSEQANWTNHPYNFFTNALVEDAQEMMYAGTENGKLISIDKKNRKIKGYDFQINDKPIDIGIIRRMIIKSDNSIWLGTTINGLFEIENILENTIEIKSFKHCLNHPENINYLYAMGQDEILCGTINNGLVHFNTKSKEFIVYSSNANDPYSLKGNSIWSIYKDSKNKIWVGIFNEGINIIDPMPEKFKSYRNISSDKNSLTDGAITGFLEDTKGNMWIASDGGGLDYWDREKNLFKHFKNIPNKNNTLSSNAVLCLNYVKPDELWVGCFSGGINIYNSQTGKFRHISMENGLNANDVFSIVNGPDNKVYIGTFRGGLNIYDPKTGIFSAVKHNPDNTNSPSADDINICYFDKKGNLWIGYNDDGLDKVSFDAKGKTTYTHYKHQYDNDKSLSENTILAIVEDKNENIWIGTRDGLNCLDTEKEEFKIFKTKDGLPDNTIAGIIEDDQGNLWISTLNGLSKFNPNSLTFSNYNKSDGLQGKKFSNRSAYYKNSKGEFFFGGNDGFSTFHPKNIKYDHSFFPMFFTDFKLFNKSVSPNDLKSPLKKSITEIQRIELEHEQSVFTIDYIAINYSDPAKIKYAYILDGLETEWNYVGGKKSATYTNLDPGKYIFKVKSTNLEGEWSKTSKDLIIIVHPPYWETWWFRVIAILTVILILYILYRKKIKDVEKNQILLKEMVEKRTAKLNEANSTLEEKSLKIYQQKEELEAQTENLGKINHKLEQSAKELQTHKEHLEELVTKRTEELEKSKEKAEESDRLKSAFLANMSHEIRTPMNAIVGFAQLLSEPDLDNEDKEKYISQINSNTSSLLNIINDILELSMIESKLVLIKKKQFVLNKLLKEVFFNQKSINRNSELKIILTNDLDSENLQLLSDPHRIKQILENLLNNARKFTDSGEVELSCLKTEEHIIFNIRDTGIGISEQNLDVIFQQFRKIIDEKTKFFRGVGLGLSISQKHAQMLDGSLSVESEPGVGSKFSFKLPVSVIVHQEKAIMNKYNWENKRILIVEDEDANFQYLKSALSKSKAEIFRADNGKNAVDLYKNDNEFNLILMDIKMPVMNGIEACIEIKKLNPEQLIIAQTAYVKEIKRSRNSACGFNDYLLKPIELNVLFVTLEKYLSN